MELPTLRQKTDTETGSRPDSLIDIGAIQVLYLLTYLLTYLLYPAIFQGDFATNSTDDLYANQQTRECLYFASSNCAIDQTTGKDVYTKELGLISRKFTRETRNEQISTKAIYQNLITLHELAM